MAFVTIKLCSFAFDSAQFFLPVEPADGSDCNHARAKRLVFFNQLIDSYHSHINAFWWLFISINCYRFYGWRTKYFGFCFISSEIIPTAYKQNNFRIVLVYGKWKIISVTQPISVNKCEIMSKAKNYVSSWTGWQTPPLLLSICMWLNSCWGVFGLPNGTPIKS